MRSKVVILHRLLFVSLPILVVAIVQAMPARADVFQLRGEATIRSFGSTPPAFGQIGERISISVDVDTNTFNYRAVANEAFHIFDSFTNYPVEVIGELSGVFPTVEPVDGLTALEVTESVNSDLLILEGIGNDVFEYRCDRSTCFDGRVTPFTSDEVFSLLYQAVTDPVRWRLPSSIPSLSFVGNNDSTYLQDVSWTVNVVPGPPPTQLDIVADVDAQYEIGGPLNLNSSGTSLIVGQNSPELRTLLEFPLDGIPTGATLDSVQLELDGFVSSGEPQLEIVAYDGDGLIGTSDVFASSTLVANTLPLSLSTGLLIDLNTSEVQSMLGSASHLGLRMRGLSGFDYVGFSSTESSFAEPAPTLIVRYFADPVPGDFNNDGAVNQQDLNDPTQGWQARYGNDLSGNDFLQWQRNYEAEPIEVIVNGDFETGALAPWQPVVTPNGNVTSGFPRVELFDVNGDGQLSQAMRIRVGKVDFGISGPAGGGIEQTFDVDISGDYRLNADIAVTNTDFTGNTGPGRFEMYFDGVLVDVVDLNGTLISPDEVIRDSLTFGPISLPPGSYTVSILIKRNATNSREIYQYVDNVRLELDGGALQAVPEPTSCALLVGNLVALTTVRRRNPS